MGPTSLNMSRRRSSVASYGTFPMNTEYGGPPRPISLTPVSQDGAPRNEFLWRAERCFILSYNSFSVGGLLALGAPLASWDVARVGKRRARVRAFLAVKTEGLGRRGSKQTMAPPEEDGEIGEILGTSHERARARSDAAAAAAAASAPSDRRTATTLATITAATATIAAAATAETPAAVGGATDAT